jgi:NAD(P) transhydrogenase subunit alpha
MSSSILCKRTLAIRHRQGIHSLTDWRIGGRNQERVISNYQLPIVMAEGLIAGLVVFTLASFVGFEVINKVPPTLHTPLMSGSNAISGIAVLGAILISGQGNVTVTSILGTIAIALATINVVGGFLVTDRMLQMFKKKEVKA